MCQSLACILANCGTVRSTSDWARVDRNYHILSEVVDTGDGRIPRQASLHKQFVDYLHFEGVNWSFRDSDDAATRLRAMLQSLLLLKRSLKPAPKNHERLQAIMDKLVVDRGRSSSPRGRRRSPSRSSIRVLSRGRTRGHSRARSSSRQSRNRHPRARSPLPLPAPRAPRLPALPARLRDIQAGSSDEDLDDLEKVLFKKPRSRQRSPAPLPSPAPAPSHMHSDPIIRVRRAARVPPPPML